MQERETRIHGCAGHAGTVGISDTGGGTGITIDAVADGREAHDGSECLEKTGHGMTAQPEQESAIRPLNDFLEITIGGVTYRVSSVFSEKGQMGELLGLAAIEKISRIA